jgi:hypothetical protein
MVQYKEFPSGSGNNLVYLIMQVTSILFSQTYEMFYNKAI